MRRLRKLPEESEAVESIDEIDAFIENGEEMMDDFDDNPEEAQV